MMLFQGIDNKKIITRIDNKKNNYKSRESTSDARIRQSHENDAIDVKFGFNRVKDYQERVGFLINMHSNEIIDEDKRLMSVVDFYFIQEDGSRFKATLPFQPYFYLLAKKEYVQEVTAYLSKKFGESILKIELILKEDLDLPNHLTGLKQRYLKVYFATVTEMTKVRQGIMTSVRKNRERERSNSYYSEMLSESLACKSDSGGVKKSVDHMENIIDIREYDVPYHVRVSIDNKIFVGLWYSVQSRGSNDAPIIIRRDDIIDRPDTIVLAFDIETSKLPLKFPDASTDQIMMISYMIDGQGYLITNREIISEDVDDFEYTPKPEFEGFFTIFNEPNEATLITRFFDHINEIKPHIFVTYNGDFFDWPFIETRAAIHGFDMAMEIGFAKNKDGIYCCRPSMHMDCLCWVKRDSYLPVGSQNLKAVAKAKLRYDPVELDPEDMCRLASEQPQVLSNYSVSDAVATYYLYMKYVHPFIFALCTIIPMEPDEVLRKGSGTLCEALLMVEAFHANIIFPNKQESVLNKMTEDGHVLDQETYVGGHVEALESGVFRADIPCRFRLIPDAITKLINSVGHAITHAVEVEEKIPMEHVTNFEDVVSDIKDKLYKLRDVPNRLENPIIYHLDVGAMYPNIILTNRLQPSAIVNETICAACDYNRPNATCQRNMTWVWRGEVMPASRSEFQRIQQQLEIEKFPGRFPGDAPRAFHQLSHEEQAAYEKKRLTDYSRKVYKKTHITRIEERTTTICQKENSFYVDTVRAFRDRRYEYKALTKVAKNQVIQAVSKGDASEIKSAKNREVVYDSLQLAHKCILNSFYGYVMRKGSRWFSMEMGGIVCCTGASIITRAREIIEQVGRPLELDTDGIWCILPGSFPENYTICTNLPKKPKVVISYPNAVLNSMVKEHYTNHVYHELVDKEKNKYIQRSENSIFFEVDGPYLAMVLPASKEEGKKLKKRYAVFNFDGSLAELKGFEVKRRGELQLIKIFQGSVFDAFLKGDTLEKCYDAVATVADYWLDVLYNKGRNMPDSELFELISENRSMSKKLADYGTQKSTSISTAKRLAEFLGDQMVKDAGLACRYIISRKPDGSPVTERAIPLAIFQSEPAIKRHYLRKWLKDNSINDVDIRDILDWEYYIERLNGAIQKIITIPAALQGVANPVPRVRHPDWLHKKMLDKTDVMKQRKISDIFKTKLQDNNTDEDSHAEIPLVNDIEDVSSIPSAPKMPIINKKKRKRDNNRISSDTGSKSEATSWREALGPAPPITRFEDWLSYQKKKWSWQKEHRKLNARNDSSMKQVMRAGNKGSALDRGTLSGFLRRARQTLLNQPWEILQVCETGQPGVLKIWALVGNELHNIKLMVPRIFYVNQRLPRTDSPNAVWSKCNRILPRSRPVLNLYQFTLTEDLYLGNNDQLVTDFSTPDVEGIYETRINCQLRTLIKLGCVCSVIREEAKKITAAGLNDLNTFALDQLQIRTLPYLKQADSLKYIYFYCRRAGTGSKSVSALFISPTNKATVCVTDSVRTNQMPNMSSLYTNERNSKLSRGHKESDLPPSNFEFEIKIETEDRQVFRQFQKKLQAYRDEKRGPTVLIIQSVVDIQTLISNIPDINDFPYVCLFMKEMPESAYTTLDWQRVGAKNLVKYYLNSVMSLNILIEQCRYLHLPIGNVPDDSILFGADIFYSRHLIKNNFLLWISETEKPDLGGREADDNRMLTEFGEGSSVVVNNPSCYSSYCIELEIDGLAVTTILQSHHVQDIEGTNWSVSFDSMPQASLEEMVEGTVAMLPTYDETALCSAAFKVLRSMVNVWLRDVSIHRNQYADDQIMQFYRWIRSSNALLYDPALHRTLYNLMKKLFMQLVAEFKRLGSIIVFANFNKIIICTKKKTMEEAVCYIKFVVQSITNKELFHSLQISFGRYWEYLMWLDLWNYAGVKGKVQACLSDDVVTASEENVDTTSNMVETDSQEDSSTMPEIEMNWNLMEFLPEEVNVRQHFSDVIAGYLGAVYLHLVNKGPNLATQQPRNQTVSQATQSVPLGVGADEDTASFAKELISGELTDKLFLITQRIHKKLPVLEINEDTFKSPFISTELNNKLNPALEFVKSVCKILSLDNEITNEVMKLRRNLLRLIGVGEFSDIAVWQDPCLSFVLPEVICKGCNHCSDLDLCKDTNRFIVNELVVWLCPNCKSGYDTSSIEFMLIDALNRKTMAYTLQDIQCKKCLQIKMDNISQYCSCSGSYQTLISESDINKHIKTFHIVAKYFKMQLLQDTVEFIINCNTMEQELFRVLKARCDSVVHHPNIDNIDEYAKILSKLPPAISNELQSYVLFPITCHLVDKQRFQDKSTIVINLLLCMKTILSKSELQSISAVLYLANVLLPLVSSKLSPTTINKDIPEELKLLVVDCLILLFTNMSEVCAKTFYNKENEKPRLVIGCVVYTCLQLARYEQLVELRLQSLECVLVITRLNGSTFTGIREKEIANDLTPFLRLSVLPGVISACKMILQTASIAHHTIYVKVLQLFGRITAVAMEDSKVTEEKDVYNYCRKIISGKDRSNITIEQDDPKEINEWFLETSIKLSEYIPTIMSVRNHSHWKVRQELLICVDLLLSKCYKNIGENVISLIETLMVLVQDDVITISSKAESFAQKLFKGSSMLRTHLTNLLEENFYSLILRIDSIICSASESVIVSELKLLNGYLKVVDLTCMLKPASHLQCFVHALIHVVQMDSSSLSTLEENYLLELDEDVLRISETSWVKMKYLICDESVDCMLKVCDTISMKGDVIDLMHYLLDLLRTDLVNRKEIIFLINNIVLNRKCCSNVDYKNMKNILQIYVDPLKFDVPVLISESEKDQKQPLTLSLVRSNILQVCLLVDGIGKMSSCMGKKFSPLLLFCLYNVLEKCGSSNQYIAAAGTNALLCIAESCNYSSVTELITENVDYIISKNLRYINYDRKLFDVLSIIIRSCSQESLQILCDIMEEVLLGNKDILHESCREGFLKVFKLFIRKLRIWFLPIFAKDYVEITESRETYVSVRSKMEEYMQQYRVSRYKFQSHDGDINDLDIHINDINESVTFDEQDESSDNKEYESHPENTEDGESKAEVPRYIDIVVCICNRILHVLPIKRISTKIVVIEVLMDSLLVLSKWENQLLPIVHKIWSPLVTSVAKENLDPLVIRRSFELICMMAVTAKDFIRSRTLKEVLPSLTKYLQQTASQSLLKDSGSIYRTSQQYKLQLSLLQELGFLAVYIRLQEKELHSILHTVTPYLSCNQPLPLQDACRELLSEIASENLCLVWIHVLSIWAPTPLLETPIYLKDIDSFEDIVIDTNSNEDSEYKTNVSKLLDQFKKWSHFKVA